MNHHTVAGNLTADPEVQFTKAGKAVAHFTIAHAPRRLDRESGSWVDGETIYLRCNAWGSTGENIAESLHKGDRVIAAGSLIQRSYEDSAGVTRTVVELDVDEIGPTLRFSTTTSTPAKVVDAPAAAL